MGKKKIPFGIILLILIVGGLALSNGTQFASYQPPPEGGAIMHFSDSPTSGCIQVYIDGQYLGFTPQTTRVTSGEYHNFRYDIVCAGWVHYGGDYPSFDVSINYIEGAEAWHVIDLIPGPTLDIKVGPPSAHWTLEGPNTYITGIGDTTIIGPKVDGSFKDGETYTVTFGDMPTWITPEPQTFTLQNKQTVVVEGIYKIKPYLEVGSNPEGALFTLTDGGTYTGTTPDRIKLVYGRTYTVRFGDMPGYQGCWNDVVLTIDQYTDYWAYCDYETASILCAKEGEAPIPILKPCCPGLTDIGGICQKQFIPSEYMVLIILTILGTLLGFAKRKEILWAGIGGIVGLIGGFMINWIFKNWLILLITGIAGGALIVYFGLGGFVLFLIYSLVSKK